MLSPIYSMCHRWRYPRLTSPHVRRQLESNAPPQSAVLDEIHLGSEKLTSKVDASPVTRPAATPPTAAALPRVDLEFIPPLPVSRPTPNEPFHSSPIAEGTARRLSMGTVESAAVVLYVGCSSTGDEVHLIRVAGAGNVANMRTCKKLLDAPSNFCPIPLTIIAEDPTQMS